MDGNVEAVAREAAATLVSWFAFAFVMSALLLFVTLAVDMFVPALVEPLWRRMFGDPGHEAVLVSIAVLAVVGIGSARLAEVIGRKARSKNKKEVQE
jgi:NADH:ubiquinone oxidoreductase subunit 3 (subunit A)